MATIPNAASVYCQKCGTPMQAEDRFCRQCGCDATVAAWQTIPPAVPANASDKKRLAALLLCFFLGVFGVHRFYVGKVGTGLLWLFTLGILGFGMLYDLILIAVGEFTDAAGRKVVVW